MTAATKLHLQRLLVSLEGELQALGWWEQQAPSAQALQSQQPFCVDTLEFAQWLQWVFVPRMRAIISSDHPLPNQCGIHDMAEVVYREQLTRVANLLSSLKRIDTAINTSHLLH